MGSTRRNSSSRESTGIQSVAGSEADARLRGFSCPQEGLDEAFLKCLASEYARSVTGLLLDAYADPLAANSAGLVELLRDWSDEPRPPHAAWSSSFGDAFTLLQAHDPDRVVPVAARIALHLGAHGLAGTWSAALGRPVPLRWGPYLLPGDAQIAVESDGDVAEVRMGEGAAGRALRLDGGIDRWHADGAELLPRFGRQRAVVLHKNQLALAGFDELVDASVGSIRPETLATLERAMDIIANHAPAYLPWVERVVHEMFLIRPQVKHIQSGSIAKYFGLVHVSATPNAAAIAELLVHEASHQYFHLLTLLDPFDDGSDGTMYYSPAVRKERSLARIGVAYHAFANILLMYDACLESNIDDDGYCRRGRVKLAPEVDQLEAPLRGNGAMTAVGRALCEPLIERLHH
jgi:HEXXH motif-containing protein